MNINRKIMDMSELCVFDAVYVCVCAGRSRTCSSVESLEALLMYRRVGQFLRCRIARPTHQQIKKPMHHRIKEPMKQLSTMRRIKETILKPRNQESVCGHPSETLKQWFNQSSYQCVKDWSSHWIIEPARLWGSGPTNQWFSWLR